VTPSQKFVTSAAFHFTLAVSASLRRCRSSHTCIKNRQDLESLHGKGAAIAAILAETQPVPCMDFQIQEHFNKLKISLFYRGLDAKLPFGDANWHFSECETALFRQ
jgi:hypothetical protein